MEKTSFDASKNNSIIQEFIDTLANDLDFSYETISFLIYSSVELALYYYGRRHMLKEERAASYRRAVIHYLREFVTAEKNGEDICDDIDKYMDIVGDKFRKVVARHEQNAEEGSGEQEQGEVEGESCREDLEDAERWDSPLLDLEKAPDQGEPGAYAGCGREAMEVFWRKWINEG